MYRGKSVRRTFVDEQSYGRSGFKNGPGQRQSVFGRLDSVADQNQYVQSSHGSGMGSFESVPTEKPSMPRGFASMAKEQMVRQVSAVSPGGFQEPKMSSTPKKFGDRQQNDRVRSPGIGVAAMSPTSRPGPVHTLKFRLSSRISSTVQFENGVSYLAVSSADPIEFEISPN